MTTPVLYQPPHRRLALGHPQNPPSRHVKQQQPSANKYDAANTLINENIYRCQNPGEILHIVSQESKIVSTSNSVFAFTRLAYNKFKTRDEKLIGQRTELLTKFCDGLDDQALDTLEPHELCNLAWTMLKLGIVNDALVSMIADRIEGSNLPDLNLSHLNNLTWVLKNQSVCNQKLIDAILYEISCRNLENIGISYLSDTLWNLTKIDLITDPIITKITCIVNRVNPGTYSLQTLHNFIWAYAALGKGKCTSLEIDFDSLMYKLGDEVIRRILTRHHHFPRSESKPDKFTPYQLVNFLWAYSKMELPNPTLLNCLSEMIREYRLCSFTPEDLSSMIWVHTKPGWTDMSLFNEIIQEIKIRDLRRFSDRDLANIFFNVSDLGKNDSKFIDKMVQEIKKRNLSKFSVHNLSNVVCALGKSMVYEKELMVKIADELCRRNDEGSGLSEENEFYPYHFANFTWAFARLKIPHHRLFNCIAKEIMRRDPETFSSPTYSQIVVSFATIEGCNPLLYEYVANQINQRELKELNAYELTSMTWAFSTCFMLDRLMLDRIFVLFTPEIPLSPDELQQWREIRRDEMSQSVAWPEWLLAEIDSPEKELGASDTFVPSKPVTVFREQQAANEHEEAVIRNENVKPSVSSSNQLLGMSKVMLLALSAFAAAGLAYYFSQNNFERE